MSVCFGSGVHVPRKVGGEGTGGDTLVGQPEKDSKISKQEQERVEEFEKSMWRNWPKS